MAATPNYDAIRHLIADKKQAEARRELKKILYKDDQEPEAWWLYAHVAEDRDQLYYILDALVELPMNPYTGKARAMLAKLPYRPTKTKSGRHLVQASSNTRLLWLGMAAVVGLAIMVIGVVALTSGSRPSTAIAIAPAATATEFVIITATPLPTNIPDPTNTPAPTATRRPILTATPLPSATATTDAAVNLTTTLPRLNDSLVERSMALFKAADTVASALSTADNLSDNALKAVTEQTNQIRKLRNDIMLVNLAVVPADVRNNVITPAHNAYTDYANSLLQWIDLKMQAYKASAALVTPTKTVGSAATADGSSTDSAVDNTAGKLNSAVDNAQFNAERQTGLAAQQEEVVRAKRTALEKALNDYGIFTAQTVLTAQISKAGKLYSSQNPQPIQVAAGKFKVSYRLGNFGTGTPALQLVPTSGKGTKVTLTNNATSGMLSEQVVDLKAGLYEFHGDAVSWWVVALDPQ